MQLMVSEVFYIIVVFTFQAYEVIMYCTKHQNHNVVTASLETLLQLLRTPPTALLSVLLSSEGITPTVGYDNYFKEGTNLC